VGWLLSSGTFGERTYKASSPGKEGKLISRATRIRLEIGEDIFFSQVQHSKKMVSLERKKRKREESDDSTSDEANPRKITGGHSIRSGRD